jgi:hypothetical protein
MYSNLISHDEPAALAYQAYQLATAGYPDEAEMIRRKKIDLSPLFGTLKNKIAGKVFSAIASLFSTSRDLPAALAYDASQFAEAGYLPETCNDDKPSGLFENVTAWIMKRPAPRTAAPCLADTVTP